MDRLDRNARATARLHRAALPPEVLAYALTCRWTPATASRAIAGFWRAHVLEAEALARRLAAATGPPAGWCWQKGAAANAFRIPPLPYREPAFDRGPGTCVVCGGPVFRLGWHADLWSRGQNRRARWHGCCVAAWKFWTAPARHRKALAAVLGRRCGASGARLARDAEVDHRVPLVEVWRTRREEPWPALLGYWGVGNLQLVNGAAHAAKSAAERRRLRPAAAPPETPAAPGPAPGALRALLEDAELWA